MSTSAASREQYDRLWSELWANTHAGGPLARTRYRLALDCLQFDAASTERALDVGAGNGAFMAEALKRSPALGIYGVEFSQAAIDLAHPDIRGRLARCDLQGEDPLPWGGAFEVITCMEVLEHLPDDMLALRHVARALAPGGRLFISVPAWEAKWGPQDVSAGHVRRYEPDVLRLRIESVGLRLLRLRCWGGPLTWLYQRATDLVGPERVMSVRPTGAAGFAASAIYSVLRLDDFLSFRRGPQLLALAARPKG